MKKLIVLTLAFASVFSFVSVKRNDVTNINVSLAADTSIENQQKPTTFAEIDTLCKVNFVADTANKTMNDVQIKFGGVADKAFFTDSNAEYGMIILDSRDELVLNGEIQRDKIDENLIRDQLKPKNYAVDLTELIKNQLDQNEVEYYWVIDNTLNVGYTRSFTAAAYKILDGKVTISDSRQESTLSLIQTYKDIADKENSGKKEMTNISEWTDYYNDFIANYPIRYTVNTGFLYNNTKDYSNDFNKGTSGDDWFELKVSNSTGDILTNVSKHKSKEKTFEFVLNHNIKDIVLKYYKQNDKAWVRDSYNLKLKKNHVVNSNSIVVIPSDFDNLLKGTKPAINNRLLYADTYTPNDKGEWQKIEKNSRGIFKDIIIDYSLYNTFSLKYKAENWYNDDSGPNNNNVWAYSPTIKYENDQFFFEYGIEKEKLEAKLGDNWHINDWEQDFVYTFSNKDGDLEPITTYEVGDKVYIPVGTYTKVNIKVVQQGNKTKIYGEKTFEITNGHIDWNKTVQ